MEGLRTCFNLLFGGKNKFAEAFTKKDSIFLRYSVFFQTQTPAPA